MPIARRDLAVVPSPREPKCRVLSLNGIWNFTPLYASPEESPAPCEIGVPSFYKTFEAGLGGDWGGYDNFGHPDKWNEAIGACYERHFIVAVPAGYRARLKFDGVLMGCKVELNGREVLQIIDGFLPYEADVTEVLQAGNNKLVVTIQDRADAGDLMLPSGSWVGWKLRGIWQDVTLRLEPEVRIADVFVHTSVRQSRLKIRATIENAGHSPASATLRCTVSGSSIELSAPVTSLPGNFTATVETEATWEEARLWSPETPHLYELKASLLLADGTGACDQRIVRFGFKEFWIDGTSLVLNGTPIRLRGDSWHYMGAAMQSPEYARTWFEFVKEIGANAVRLHAMPHPEFFLDIADELGVCIVDESAVYGSGGNLALKDDRFWSAARDHVRRLVRRDRNHPSVCLWSASNEVVWKGGPESFPGLLSLAEAIHEEDPTRPVSFDENCSDLGGAAAMFSGHYGSLAAWAKDWKQDKPLMLHEFSCLYWSGPEEPSRWGGEASFADFDARTRSAGEEAREMIIGLRAIGAASVTPWNFVWYGLDPAFPFKPVTLNPDIDALGIKTTRLGENCVSLNYDVAPGERLEPAFPGRYRPNAAFELMKSAYVAWGGFLRDRANNFFAGDRITRTVDVFNDLPERARFDVKLSFGSAHAQTDFELEPTEHRAVTLDLRVPEAASQQELDLVVQTERSKGDVSSGVHEDRLACWIAPRLARPALPAMAITLVDDSGATAALLERLGYRFSRLNSDSPVFPADARVGVIGRGSMKTLTLEKLTVLAREQGFFARGGVIIVLEDALAPDDESPISRVDKGFERAWRRAWPELWNSIPSDESLRYWSQDASVCWPNGMVARSVFRKPSTGEALILAEVADGNEGLEFSPLLFAPIDRGGVVINSFELVENAERHPAAGELLCGLIELAANGRTPCVGADAVQCFPRASRLADFTHEVGADVDTRDDSRVVVVDCTDPVGAELNVLCSILSDGGTVILNEVSEHDEILKSLTGIDIGIQTGEWQNVAKAHGREFDAALESISQDDLMWVRRGQWEPICTSALKPNPAIESLIVTVDTQWAGYADTPEQHKYALMLRRRASFAGEHTVVGRIRVGNGTVLVSQIRFASCEHFGRKAQRVWSALLRNAGAAFKAEASPLIQRRSQFVDEAGYIRKWALLGIYGVEESTDPSEPRSKRLLTTDFVEDEAALEPSPDAAIAGRTWRTYAAPEPAVNLREGFAGEQLTNVAAYMGVWVFSPRSRDIILDTPDMVDLCVGTDDGVRVWLNGEEILTVLEERHWHSDADRLAGVKLRRGWNRLVLKVSQRGWEWKASVRFVTTAGHPVGGLRYGFERGVDF